MKKAKITDFTQDSANANKGSEKGLRMLDDSIASVGLGRSIVVDKHNRIIAGNKTQERAIDRGLEDAIVIETNGDKLVVVKRNDLDLADSNPNNPARKLAYYDNRAAELDLSWDVGQLIADMQSGMDLSPFFDMPIIDALTEAALNTELDDIQGSPEDTPQLTRHDVPDAIFPSDNEFGIPTLDINLCADALDLPFELWGAQKRPKRMGGTWGFYVYDYYFTALWQDPSPVVNTACVNAVEPNFSIGRDTPRVYALWNIYRKRYMARFWQMHGIKIFVDLNVPNNYQQDNLIGVPKGWKAYMSRGYDSAHDEILAEYELACEHAGTSSIVYAVYGGGAATKAFCKEHNWIHLTEVYSRKREKDGGQEI